MKIPQKFNCGETPEELKALVHAIALIALEAEEEKEEGSQ